METAANRMLRRIRPQLMQFKPGFATILDRQYADANARSVAII
jgi:hypothetical protein